MTEVSFHFDVPDKIAYACRLLRKAVRSGSSAVVAAPMDTLAQLDRALWAFDPLDFVAHVLVRPGQATPARFAPTPVWLAEQPADAPHQPVLLNLGREPAAGFESFERLIELVSRDDDDRQAGRRRWKHYSDRGYAIGRHQVAA